MMKNSDLYSKLVHLYPEKREDIIANDTPEITRIRDHAFDVFKEKGFPGSKTERWRNTDLSKQISHNYIQNFKHENGFEDAEKILRCEVPDFETELLSLLNGWYSSKETKLKRLESGVIVGGLARAMQEFPEIVGKYYALNRNYSENSLDALNAAFAQDGFFIFVPANTRAENIVQMVNMINHDQNLFVQNRNLVILEKNSYLTLVHCDDSLNQQRSFTNSVTEIFMDENAHLNHYKLQNINDHSAVINTAYFHQKNNSTLTTNVIVLNGGMIRNDIHVKLDGSGCDSNIYGLYLVDKEQHVDNQVYVDHILPHSTSNELFKGIVDDHAHAVFNGHIHVYRDAQKTNAFQNNRNLLLTDKATVNSKPFLEIYADDVKCSHGATVGQLDQDAMFYIRSRGLSEDNARLLLMYAFAAEVIQKIKIDSLRHRVDDLVKKRLRGELSICDQCVLNCRDKENVVSFEIDMSRI